LTLCIGNIDSEFFFYLMWHKTAGWLRF
jgi:hypothetical protein